jgi:hypothetical protein
MLINQSITMENSKHEAWNSPQPVHEDNKKIALPVCLAIWRYSDS